MKPDSRTIWNEAGRVGFVFGGFSSLCFVLKEGAGLTGSTFLIQAAAIILWAVEFFGCILLMKSICWTSATSTRGCRWSIPTASAAAWDSCPA